jgi:hypothetical protein
MQNDFGVAGTMIQTSKSLYGLEPKFLFDSWQNVPVLLLPCTNATVSIKHVVEKHKADVI